MEFYDTDIIKLLFLQVFINLTKSYRSQVLRLCIWQFRVADGFLPIPHVKLQVDDASCILFNTQRIQIILHQHIKFTVHERIAPQQSEC